MHFVRVFFFGVVGQFEFTPNYRERTELIRSPSNVRTRAFVRVWIPLIHPSIYLSSIHSFIHSKILGVIVCALPSGAKSRAALYYIQPLLLEYSS